MNIQSGSAVRLSCRLAKWLCCTKSRKGDKGIGHCGQKGEENGFW